MKPLSSDPEPPAKAHPEQVVENIRRHFTTEGKIPIVLKNSTARTPSSSCAAAWHNHRELF